MYRALTVLNLFMMFVSTMPLISKVPTETFLCGTKLARGPHHLWISGATLRLPLIDPPTQVGSCSFSSREINQSLDMRSQNPISRMSLAFKKPGLDWFLLFAYGRTDTGNVLARARGSS